MLNWLCWTYVLLSNYGVVSGMDQAEPFTGKNGNCMMGFPTKEREQCGKNPELNPDEPTDVIFQEIELI